MNPAFKFWSSFRIDRVFVWDSIAQRADTAWAISESSYFALLVFVCKCFDQNRRQEVVNRGALRLCGGALRSCRGGLTFKFDQNSTNL